MSVQFFFKYGLTLGTCGGKPAAGSLSKALAALGVPFLALEGNNCFNSKPFSFKFKRIAKAIVCLQ